MTSFAFDNGDRFPDIIALSATVDETQNIRFRHRAKAQAAYNKIRENIEAHEDAAALDAYMARESLILDALHLFDQHVAADLQDIYETHRACLTAGRASELARSEKTF